MKLLGSFLVLAVGIFGRQGAEASQSQEKPVRQVAIIGAGAAGSSAAYHLHKYSAEEGLPVNITIFEKTDRIGGRARTVNLYDSPGLPAELGASIFIKINYIIYNAVEEFNLTLKDPGSDEAGLLAVWDGERFVYEQDENSWDWWNLAKLFWKYGLAPYNARKLMQTTIQRFLQLYEPPLFPFRSLTTRAYELNLTYVTGFTGEQFLALNKIDGLFAHDIIQASTRVNYASNLAKIHGLDTMVALAPEGASQVEGGNWQIFHSMVKKSGAGVQLNTSVSHIGFEERDAPGKSRAKYVIKTKSAGTAEEDGAETTEPLAFDKVIIANPYQYSNIKLGDGVLQQEVEEVPYVTLHVTLFTSPFRFSSGFFNLPAGDKVPTTVLTTLAPDDDASSGASGAGKAGFFSISTLRTVRHPDTGRVEFLYKIFSPEKVTSEFLSLLFGVPVPETFTTPAVPGQTGVVDPISWYHPHVFHSYPKALPRITFQDPILGDGLYYTSGIESFISTMETSALMGKNVARLVADDLATDAVIGQSSPAGHSAVFEDDNSQAVLVGGQT